MGKRPDRAPLVFSGSKVLEGGGRALVTAVGANSQQGLISGMVATAQEQGDSLRCAPWADMQCDSGIGPGLTCSNAVSGRIHRLWQCYNYASSVNLVLACSDPVTTHRGKSTDAKIASLMW